MWQALPFAIAVVVAAGNIHYEWTTVYASAILLLAGAAISIALVAALRGEARRRRQAGDIYRRAPRE